MTPFDYLNSINNKDKNLREELKDYAPFMINRGLSFYPDTVLLANEMNVLSATDKVMQYDFYFNSVSKRKRFSKWFKADEDEKVSLLIDLYSCSRGTAREYAKLLTDEDFEEIKAHFNYGGKR